MGRLNLTGNRRAEETLLGVIDRSFTAQHLTLQEIELGNFLPSDVLESSTIVAVIRDPLDRSLFSLQSLGATKVNRSDRVTVFRVPFRYS